MAVSKVIYNNRTLMDVTSDTVTEDSLVEGATATAADGTKITGSLKIAGYTVAREKPADSEGKDGDIWYVYDG